MIWYIFSFSFSRPHYSYRKTLDDICVRLRAETSKNIWSFLCSLIFVFEFLLITSFWSIELPKDWISLERSDPGSVFIYLFIYLLLIFFCSPHRCFALEEYEKIVVIIFLLFLIITEFLYAAARVAVTNLIPAFEQQHLHVIWKVLLRNW